QDGSLSGIFAQRYSASGASQGSEFQVNAYTTSNQRSSSVAMDSAGDFVVAWQSFSEDGSLYGVYAQRYNSSGVAQGTEFLVNTYTTSYQKNPSAAMDSAGDIVIAWQSYGEDGSLYGVYAQRYNPTGLIQGTEFQVNTYTTGNQANPSVAMDSAGDFVVAWQSYGEDGSAYGVYAQRYAAIGTPPVMTTTSNALSYTASSGAQAIDPGVAVVDTESPNIVSATVTISANYDPNHDTLGFTAQNAISGIFNSTSGTLTLTGTATVANYQTALESVTFACSNVAASTNTRILSFQVNDGTNNRNVASRTINLLDSGPATQLILLTQPPATVAAGTGFGFTVAVEDSLGNVVGGFSGSVTVGLFVNPGNSTLGGTLTSAATSGLAVFSGLTFNKVAVGYTLDCSSGSLTAASTGVIRVVPGAATQLILKAQPPATLTAGTNFGLTVTAEDVDGNLATGFSGSVTIALANNPGSSTLGGTSAVSATSGVAVFPNLTVNKVGTGYTLLVESPTLTAATSSGFQVIPAAPSQFVIGAPLPTNITVGAPFGFTISAEDAEGNLTPAFAGSVAVAITTNPGGGGTLTGTTTVSSTGGVAVFSGLKMNGVASGYKLSVTGGGLPPLVLGPFNVTALGVATHLVIESAPPATVAPGAAFGVTVEAEDDFGTLATSFNGGVTIALANNPGAATLSGMPSATANAGVAAFTGLSLNNPGLGYTLQATSSGLTAGTTNPFNVVGTLTINGTSTNSPVQITFLDATDFQVVLNGGPTTNYSTTAATKVVYNGPAGTPSEVVFADKFNTYKATQSFASTDIVTPGFEFDAENVVELYIYASNGQSTATVTVGTGSENNFYVGDAASDYSYIRDPALGLYSELSGFASESITGSGSTTYAYVYSTSNGAFVGDPGGSTYAAGGFALTLNNLPQVYAVGAADGTDKMTLHTEGGSFVGQPSFSYVSGTFNEASFLVGAVFAANVTAQATHATDQAFFYSYPGDTFNGAQGTSVLIGSATGFASFSTFVAQATGFQSVTVLESGAGTDVANLTSPGNGIFTETPTASTLVVGGVTVITVDTFFSNQGALVAVPSTTNVTGSPGDTADLYDSTGTNALVAQGNKATLTTPVNTVGVAQFGKVNAFQQSGTTDTVHEQSVDFALQTIGNWTSD
ncbi:MAG TPA: hypothetical protein VG125_25035, partial [Pirellulales bacterium]|nr:hypothetical protein [Pirellulales bacterium]